jgi:hypothetical protein
VSRRILFVGASGPIGYDYAWSDGEVASREPFAVLEDLNGILICYDQLWFLSRAFCPRDMWDLPYVKFVSDDAALHGLVETAASQADLIRPQQHFRDTVYLPDVIDVVTQGNPSGVDNHSRGIKITPEYDVMGNAGDLHLVASDMLIGSALSEPGLDVLTNSVGTARFVSHTREAAAEELELAVPAWRVAVAAHVATLRIPNVYESGRGGYVEEIEDLRSHPNVGAFRRLLSSSEVSAGEAADAAAEINDMADRFARRYVGKKFKRKPWYVSAGKLAVAPVGNAIQPGLGTAANGGIKVAEYFKDRDDRSVGAWAAFVADLRP